MCLIPSSKRKINVTSLFSLKIMGKIARFILTKNILLFIHRCIHKRTENRCSNKNLGMDFSNSANYSWQPKGGNSPNGHQWWVDKQIKTQPYIGILFSCKRNEVLIYVTTLMLSDKSQRQEATLKNKILIHTTTWKNLENIMLCERSQPQSPHAILLHLHKCPE